MKLKFDANQDYQLRAIQAVTNLFQGQPRFEIELSDLTSVGDHGALVVPNVLHKFSEAKLLSNLQSVQTENGLPGDTELRLLEGTMTTQAGEKVVSFPNFSVEMETGTGKTYVYLRTMLELHKRYGLRKFIVVVPSVAVREGVLKTLRITQRHFKAQYGNAQYNYFVYDSDNLSDVRQFASSTILEIMVMTIDSFKKAGNVIHVDTDLLQGEAPIHLIQATHPILILDEPQNMESEVSIAGLSALNPLLALRYSATHRNPYNVLYRLTPYEAYRQRLVKQIEVAGMVKDEDASKVFLKLEAFRSEKHTVTARIAIHRLQKSSKVQEVVVVVKPGTSLRAKSNMEAYEGYEVEEINISGGFVRFANNVELRAGDSVGGDKEAIFRAQIGYTIEEHFRKQERLRSAGIKVLSLFFIDRVDNYVGTAGTMSVTGTGGNGHGAQAQEGGIIRRLFDEEFNRLKGRYEAWKELDPASVRAAYFAQKRKAGGAVEFVNSTTGKTREDEVAFDLIMRDKEALLSFPGSEDDDEVRRRKQVGFIFSHSALREGWDNPNVFQICTLHQSVSEIKKRQEIGRGIRLCVNQAGERVHDDGVNILTVVANSSYQRYVEGLQAEIIEEYGAGAQTPPVGNSHQKKVYHKKPQVVLTPEFQELWDSIKRKTRYTVTVDSPRLIADVVAALATVQVRAAQVSVTKAQVVVGQEASGVDTFEARQLTATKAAQRLQRNSLPNLVYLMENLMQQTTNPVRISRKTLFDILQQAPNKQAMLDNPFEFATACVAIIKEKLLAQIVDGIQYAEQGEWYDLSRLEDSVETSKPLVPAVCSVYDSVPYDSDNEANFVKGLERRADVKVYLKLPNWFKVETPVGEYNPDWAIAIEDRDEHDKPTGITLYMVAETKTALDPAKLRSSEALKVKCGRRHFQDALNTRYCVVTDADKLPCAIPTSPSAVPAPTTAPTA